MGKRVIRDAQTKRLNENVRQRFQIKQRAPPVRRTRHVVELEIIYIYIYISLSYSFPTSIATLEQNC